MGRYIEAAKTSDIKDGGSRKIPLEGQEVLLCRIGDTYYAVINKCTHLGGDLSRGQLEGKVITCPRHGSQFDLTDGSVVRWLKGPAPVTAIFKVLKPPKALKTYDVKVDGDKILIEI